MFKILIVDPNEPFRRALKKVLNNRFSFIEILEAVDAIEAAAMVQDFDPNLIFLEIHLPSESGLDLARRIKSGHPEIVMVILTSYNLPEYKQAAEESRIEHFVPKNDWTAKDMVDLVRTILTDLNIGDRNQTDRHQPQECSP
jgi:CheY-like chemotaxis protein